MVQCGAYVCALLSPVSGIVMTFGDGMSGCLGHGDYNDVKEVSYLLSHDCLMALQ